MYRHRFLTLQVICGVSFYIAIPIARIQAHFWQGFGIPLKTENGKPTFIPPPPMNIKVVTEWFRKILHAYPSPKKRIYIGHG